MANASQGFAYEGIVIEALDEAGILGNRNVGAGANANLPDADMVINGQHYNVEVKLAADAQMGGTSVRYDPSADEFNIVDKTVDLSLAIMITDALTVKKDAIMVLIEYLNSYKDPIEYNINVDRFPLSCTKDAWTSATSEGLLRPLNTKISADTSFITAHYSKKNTFYIQIGNAGLFYMGSNPANLPIPPLEGTIAIELRACRSGSKALKGPEQLKVVGGGLRAQGRLQFKGSSPYTLDNSESIQSMLKAI